MYEPINAEVDRAYGEGYYRSYTINFIGRLMRIVEAGHTTMRLYEWADRGRLLYLVHVEEENQGGSPAHPLPVHQHPLRWCHPQEGIHRRGGISGLSGTRRREISGDYLELAPTK